MNPSRSRRRALVFTVTMGAALVGAESIRPRSNPRAAAPDDRLEDVFPGRIGEWQVDGALAALVRPADEQGKLYGIYDAVLERTYVNPHGESVMLSVAYGSNQSPALQVHRPEVCYASAGFEVKDVHGGVVPAGGRRLPVTRLHAWMPGRSEPVTYWTVLDDEVVDGKRAFRWRQLASGLRGRIVQGMLVRISSIGRDRQAAYRNHDRFAADLLAALQERHRDRVFGALPKYDV